MEWGPHHWGCSRTDYMTTLWKLYGEDSNGFANWTLKSSQIFSFIILSIPNNRNADTKGVTETTLRIWSLHAKMGTFRNNWPKGEGKYYPRDCVCGRVREVKYCVVLSQVWEHTAHCAVRCCHLASCYSTALMFFEESNKPVKWLCVHFTSWLSQLGHPTLISHSLFYSFIIIDSRFGRRH